MPKQSKSQALAAAPAEIVQPGAADIAKLAYRFYEDEGRLDGNDVTHWLRAEQALRGGDSAKSFKKPRLSELSVSGVDVI